MIFLDRSLPKSVARALQLILIGDDVKWLEDVDGLSATSPDELWLEMAGKGEWLVITRDRHISYRQAERSAAIAYQVGMFVIREKRALNRWDLAKILVCNMDRWRELYQTTPRPFIYEFTKSGKLRRTL